MRYKKLGFMLKSASLTKGFSLFPDLEVPLAKAPIVQQNKMPKTPKIEGPKLTTTTGKSKPLFTHELKSNSPYNTN